MRHARTTLTTLLAVSLLAAASTPAPAQQFRERFRQRMEQRRAQTGDAQAGQQQALPAGTRVQRNLAYGTDSDQRYDVYLPARLAPNAPILFMAHGGGWRRGDKAQPLALQAKLDHWLGRGLALVSVNYRLLPDAAPLQQADDVARALAHAQAGASAWGAEASGFALVGHSAGAHLLLLLAADPALAQAHGAQPWRATVALDTAAVDVVALMRVPHLPLHDQAFGDDPAYWRQVSPLHRLHGRMAAPLLVVGSARRPLAWRMAEAFAERVRGGGQQALLCPLDLGHGELNRGLGEPGPLTDAVDAFLAAHGLA